MTLWIIAPVLLLFLLSCNGEETGQATSEVTPTSSQQEVATPTSSQQEVVAPTSSQQEVVTPPSSPEAASPTPKRRPTDYREPNFPCGPSFGPSYEFFPDFVLWTPDSSHLVFSHGGAIFKVGADGADTDIEEVVNANRDSIVPGGSPELNYGSHASLSPNGARLIYSSCQFLTDYDVAEWPRQRLQEEGTDWYEWGKYHYEIGLVDIDGGGQQRLTNNRWLDHYPVWSPSGNRIAFVSESSYRWNDFRREVVNWDEPLLYTMSVDGSDVQQIGPQSGGIAITPPVWSPDGERLAFVVNEIDEESRWSGLRDLYTVRTDGSELVKIGLAGERGRSALTTVATWSPDSQRLAFASYDGEEWLIQTARFDGTDLKEIWRIDPNNASISWIWSVLEVSWSPDGSEILFASGEAYVIHADGSGFRNLGIPAPRERGAYMRVAWSPDGSEIAVYRPGLQLFTVSRDGTDLRVIAEAGRNGWLQVAQPEAATDPATSTPDPALPKPTATPPGLGQG